MSLVSPAQVSWSNDDLRGDVSANQNMPCGTFYANLCAHDSATLTSLVDLPPSAPPPPMAPDADLTQLTVTRVMAKGGLVDLDITTALTACADNAQTECVATELEQPWLLFDLGAQHDRLYSARLYLMPPSSPSPPWPPPPQNPPAPPASTGRRLEIEKRWAKLDNLTLHREAMHRRLQGFVVEPTGAIGGGDDVACDLNVEADRLYASTPSGTLSHRQSYPATDAVACEHDCVRNPICNYWSWQQQTDTTGQCLLFNQVTQLITAEYAASVTTYTADGWVSGSCSPERNPTAYHMPGTLEIWVSRSLALFGTRAAVIDTTRLHDGETTVYLTEGVDMAEGRYIYLRSFDSNRQLRIDGMNIFAMPNAGRRLDDEQVEGRIGADSKADEYADKKHIPNVPEFSWTRIWAMRNLTMITCLNETNAPRLAKESRQHAAMLWADLTEEESLIGCTSCITRRPSNCTQWFTNLHGVRRGHTEFLEKKRRQMREQLDRDEPERIRQLQEAVGSSCCRTNRRTGEKKCGKEFCTKAVQKKAEQRMAHVLREMHDRPGKTQLNIAQLVSTDMVSPWLHHNENCQTEKGRDDHGHVECIASSLIKHLGDKHGFSEAEVNKKMERYGMTLADIMTAQLRHGVSSGQGKKKEYQSDTKAADQASAIRRSEQARRKLGIESDLPVQKKAPKASWLKKSTKTGRLLSEGEPDHVIGVEALARSGKELRLHKKQHEEFIYNQSSAAKGIMKAANLAVASHGGTPATMTNLMGAAWEASVASDGSLLGRMRSVMTGFGRMGDKIEHMRNIVNDAKSVSAPSPPPSRKRRKLSEREEAYFNRVDEMTNGASRGFKVPDHIDEQWGWVADSVDWSYWWDEAHRVGRVLYSRHDWVHQHAEDTGTLPVGELPEHHKTGYSFLDINAPPTTLGTWVRSKFEGGEKHAPHRRLKEKRKLSELPRAAPPEGYEARSVVGAFVDAAVNDRDPIDAAWEALHYNNHHEQRTRRLAELASWVSQETTDQIADYGAELAPVLFGPSTGSVPGEAGVPTEEGLEFPRQVARYATYDTMLCYLYPPPHIDGGPMGDGTPIELHYSNRACFPMSKSPLLEHAARHTHIHTRISRC